MKRIATAIMIVLLVGSLSAQNRMTPELLWNLGRVSPLGISLDGQSVVYRVTSYHKDSNELTTKDYMIPVAGGSAVQIENGDNEKYLEKITILNWIILK
jgi:hypothetical protein